jgi:Ca2+-binding EF-hand superfamily protein
MATHRIFILAFAALPFVAGAAAAQDPGRYRGWDRNDDGVITRAEWRGTAQQFLDLDWNRDGVLSGTELRVDEESDDQLNAGTFVSLDRNRDGRIARGEWLGDRTVFQRADRNNDNFLSRGEFINAEAVDVVRDREDFETLDYNNNGRIERNEWTGTRPTFNRLDVNRDGTLSRRELAANDAVVAGRDDFDMQDYNNNGVVSRSEWRGTTATFNQYDRNRDGMITRAEYSATADTGAVVREAIRVDARNAWTNTGIYVNAGDVITFRSTGIIQMSTDTNDRATPAGSVTGRNADRSPRPDQRAGGLLLRVGTGSIAFLGDSGTFTAQNSGELFLGVNDDHLDDNSGEYRVALSIRR